MTCVYAALSVGRRMAIPRISHASWLLGRGGLCQVADISGSCVGCAGLLWHVVIAGMFVVVFSAMLGAWFTGFVVLSDVGIVVFDSFQHRGLEAAARLPA